MSESGNYWGRHYPAKTWGERLVHARDASEVVLVAQDFVSAWQPDELAALPSECRPTEIESGVDVAEFARVQAIHQFDTEERSAGHDRMTAFFVKASCRIAEVSGAMLPTAINAPAAYRPH